MTPISIPPRIRHETLSHPHLPASDRPVIERWLSHAVAYAALERAVLDDVTFDMPLHDVVVDPDGSNVNEEARVLAATARTILGIGDVVDDLVRVVESHGGRVYEMTMSPTVFGVFAFEGEIAPAYLLNRRLVPEATTMVLAELYAHFFAHTDPYRVEVVGDRSLRPIDGAHRVRRDRARAFAREFVMPADRLHGLFDPGDAVDPDAAVTLVAGYFDVPPSAASDQLEHLGYGVEARDLDDWLGPDRGDRVPERFVRLALEGMHTDRLAVDELAELLDIETEEAIAFLRLSSGEEGGDEEEPEATEPPCSPPQ